MNFFNIGRLSGYTKNLDMKAKWNNKKKTGDFQSQSKKTELERKNDSFKDYWYSKQNEPDNDEKMQNINNKVAAGKDLTPDELRYLESKNPMLYHKIKNDKDEEKAFERDLKHCKTKDDVERLKTNTVTKSLSVIGSVKNNPNIPEGTKAAIAASEMQKLKKLEEISAKFVKSGEYAKLPTEAEVRKAEKEIAEAEKAEREKAAEGTDENDTHKSEHSLQETETAITDKKAENTEKTVQSEKEQDTFQKETETVTQAEYSPEAQKMKRAKAKNAYIQIHEKTGSSDAVPFINTSLYDTGNIK